MRNAKWIWGAVAIVATGAGCGDDASTPGDAGIGADDASRGVDSGSDAGAGTDGSAGDAGGGDAGPVPGCTFDSLLITTSDYVTGGLGVLEIATGDTETDDAADDQDTIAATMGCSAVLLERGAGNLRVQSDDDAFATVTTVDLDPAGTTTLYATNPAGVVAVDETKAYVIASARNEVVVVDPMAGEVTSTIDLSAYLDPDDADGLVDAVSGLRVGDRVFVALGNYWFDDSFAIHFEGSVLAVIDATTDALVDVDGTSAGVQGVDLSGENPWRGLWADEAGDSLWVGSAGDSFALDGILEEIDLGTLAHTRTIVTEETIGAELGGFEVVAPDRVLVLAGTSVIAFDPTMTFPSSPAPIATGVDGMLLHDGSLFTWTRAGESAGLRRFDAASGSELTPAGGPWTFGTLPIYSAVPAP